MTRLYHNREWFDELSPLALAETEFENLLIQNSALIRPNASMVQYKKLVHSDNSSAKADLAVIDNSYRFWSVVEVEMLRHNLYGHVLPQVRTLRGGLYDKEQASYLAKKHPGLDEVQLADMLRGQPPDVIVLVNKYDDEWARELRRYDVHMIVFELFRSRHNTYIFRVDGKLPDYTSNVLSELSLGKLLPRMLTVSAPATLGFRPGDKVPIIIDGQVTYWERFDTATECYIFPSGVMPIKPGMKYILTRDDEGQHYIHQQNN